MPAGLKILKKSLSLSVLFLIIALIAFAVLYIWWYSRWMGCQTKYQNLLIFIQFAATDLYECVDSWFEDQLFKKGYWQK